jgi:2-oxo-3-hexenedioate decarboxylase/2-keto-4-pentenoate hydratase
MHSDAICHAARLLAEHRLTRKPLEQLPGNLRPRDPTEAYRLQDQLHQELIAALGPIAGHKIGCTTPVMQRFLNIPSPCAGGVFAATVYRSPARVPHGNFVMVGVECEIVVRLGHDLSLTGEPFTRDSVATAVSEVMAGMEIVDARYVDYKMLDTPTLIADDFFDAGCVLGEPLRDWQRLDLAAVSGATWINDVEVGKGRGQDVMGHPFEALAWLANNYAARGKILHGGEFVFTGSVVETKWVNAGDKVVMEITQLGRVEAQF